MARKRVAAVGAFDRDLVRGALVDSANWDSPPYAAIKKISYLDFDRTMTAGAFSSINAIRNRETPLLHPYTARINVTHPVARSYLEVSIGAVGHAPLVVWNQNNRNTAGKFDWVKTLRSTWPCRLTRRTTGRPRPRTPGP